MTKEIQAYKQIMKERGITQVMLSQQTGIPIRTLNDIFRGKTTNPRIETIKAIEKVLEIETCTRQSDWLNLADFEKLPNSEKIQIANFFNFAVMTFT
ncbi:MAG: helix-turn-helix transcriptional regulator, partial [Clostridia bacterium]|nr:helix-turn-helix transcriptional regulator [Clostridia bacterium]